MTTLSVPAGYAVKIGGNYFVDCARLITYDDEPLFNLRRLPTGELGIDFDIYDAQGRKIGEVRESNVVAGDRDQYLLTRTKDWHCIANRTNGVEICRIVKNPKESGVELSVTVRMYTPDGFLLEADADRINIGTNTMVGCMFSNCRTGIAIGINKGGAGISFPKPR